MQRKITLPNLQREMTPVYRYLTDANDIHINHCKLPCWSDGMVNFMKFTLMKKKHKENDETYHYLTDEIKMFFLIICRNWRKMK